MSHIANLTVQGVEECSRLLTGTSFDIFQFPIQILGFCLWSYEAMIQAAPASSAILTTQNKAISQHGPIDLRTNLR